MTIHHNLIRANSCNICKLCGEKGKKIYEALTDHLFNAPGVWNLTQCKNEHCGLVWLDPMPLEEDISIAYQNYYTHQSEVVIKDIGKILSQLVRKTVSITTGLFNEQTAIDTRYLDNNVTGNLLEIGCGAGDYLNKMKNLGWTVQGVEIDPVACQYAQEVNLIKVHQGTVESAAYPDNFFDAIVTYHVIEHVHDFVGMLKECHRIIKPKGKVVIITPNINSWAHHKFKENWRGLEPPRHLYLFSQETIKTAANLADFPTITVKTTPATADRIIRASMDLANAVKSDMNGENKKNPTVFDKVFRNIKALFYQHQEYQLWKKDPTIGEEIVLICQK
jgi:2-polyprenyl-3-methyl-5-hydroxy-6-metoxy-1,4-benzoquinol methylase